MSVSKLLPRQFLIGIVASISLSAGPGIAHAAVPMLINFEGELRSPATGEPVPDGAYTMLFRIYDVEFGGTPLWEDIYSTVYDNAVEVRDGIVSVLLGSGEGDPLDPSLFNGADRWLEIRVETETLEPRQKMCSVPYAMMAENSRLLDGRPASDFALAAQSVSATGPGRIEGSSEDAMLYVQNLGTGPALDCEAVNSDYAIRGHSSKESGYGVYGLGDGDEGCGVAGFSAAADGVGVWGSATGEYCRAVKGTAKETGDVENYGGYFEADGDRGCGVWSTADGEHGVAVEGRAGYWGDVMNRGGFFVAYGGMGRGVQGRAFNPGDFVNHGGYFEAFGGAGRGATCIATGSMGIGVYAEGTDAGVYSEGDLVVTGAYRGVLGPNNGAPFPRPAYDSGWVEVPEPNRCTYLRHDLGGDPDNYVVDMQFRDPYQGVHQRHYGGNWVGPNPINEKGLIWRDLDSDSIGVCRLQNEDWVTHFRVRIWVYN